MLSGYGSAQLDKLTTVIAYRSMQPGTGHLGTLRIHPPSPGGGATVRRPPYPKENDMESTRITIVLDVQHDPEVDLPLRAAVFLTRMLSDVDGFDSIAVSRGGNQ